MEEYRDAHLKHNPEYPQVCTIPIMSLKKSTIWVVKISYSLPVGSSFFFFCFSITFVLKFIVGPDIAILCIDVTSARICNINDEVVQWTVTDQPSCIDVDKPKSATGNNSQ